jgi:hypothetical protein
MSYYNGPKLVTNGLICCLDAANVKSYTGSGNSWADLSGNNNTGTLSGPTFSSANVGSIAFDGTDDIVTISNPTTIRNQNFAFSVWLNPLAQNTAIISIIDFDHATVPSQGWVLQSEDATTNRYYYLGWHDGTQFQPVGGFGAGLGIQVTTSRWQNIVYSKNGTSLLGYLNGAQVYNRTGTSSNVNYQSSRNLRIGSCIGAASRVFKGNISHFSIYNRALSAIEVLENYNATKSRFGL